MTPALEHQYGSFSVSQLLPSSLPTLSTSLPPTLHPLYPPTAALLRPPHPGHWVQRLRLHLLKQHHVARCVSARGGADQPMGRAEFT